MKRQKVIRLEAIYYIGLFAVSLLISLIAVRAWNMNPSVPINFSQDGIGWSVIIKNYIEGGHISYFKNYGAPFFNT